MYNITQNYWKHKNMLYFKLSTSKFSHLQPLGKKFLFKDGWKFRQWPPFSDQPKSALLRRSLSAWLTNILFGFNLFDRQRNPAGALENTTYMLYIQIAAD